MRKCSRAECDAPAIALDLCRRHYDQDYYARHREEILEFLRNHRPSRSKHNRGSKLMANATSGP